MTRLTVGFDGGMIILAMIILSVFHPSRLLTEDATVMRFSSDTDVEIMTIGKAI